MDFKFERLLVPVMLSFCISGNQRVASDVQLAPLSEIIRKCTNLEVGTQVGLDADCSTFSTCQSKSNPRYRTHYCTSGTLFDVATKLCSAAKQVECGAAADPCSNQPNGLQMDSVRSKKNQAAVRDCLNGRTVGGRLCGKCETFGSSENDCVPISGCVAVEAASNTSCTYDGQIFNHTDTLRPEPSKEPCKICTCLNGEMGCGFETCDTTNCTDAVAVVGECCPRCPVETPNKPLECIASPHHGHVKTTDGCETTYPVTINKCSGLCGDDTGQVCYPSKLTKMFAEVKCSNGTVKGTEIPVISECECVSEERLTGVQQEIFFR